MKKNCCPHCGAEFKIRINKQDGPVVEFYFVDANTKENMLLKALHEYWRWKAEGEVKYHRGCGATAGEPVQYYYDGYHDYIKYIPEEDAYEFNIQTFDSPEGDSWWRGKFKYKCMVGKGLDRHRELIYIIDEGQKYV